MQLLAIVLRDQSQSTLVISPVIDPVCDCICKCETPEPRPRETSFSILYILLSFALGSLASITCVALWWKSHGPVESRRSRRRGGGVLSEAD